MKKICLLICCLIPFISSFGQYTKLIKDISLYPNESSFPNQLTLVNNKLLFTATHDTTVYFDGKAAYITRNLWSLSKRDSSVEVIRLFPQGYNLAYSYPSADEFNIGSLTSAGNYALFQSNDYVNGKKIWRTDGTVEGTYLLKDFPSGSSYIPNFTVHKGIIYFLYLYQLWRSDGTVNGTYLVKDLQPNYFGTSYLSALISVGDYLYFMGNLEEKTGLWRSDGTNQGTAKFVEGSYTPPNPQVYNNEVFYTLEGPALTMPSIYHSIWKFTDSMQPIKLAEGSDSTWTQISTKQIIDGKMYFVAAQKESSDSDIWILDLAKNEPPIRWRSILPTLPPDLFGFKGISKWKGDFYLQTYGGLWKINEITQQATNVGEYDIFGQYNNNLILITPQTSNPIWYKYDGTQQSPKMLKGKGWPYISSISGVSPTNKILLDNKLYFAGNGQNLGTEVMALDGDSLYVVKDLNKMNPSSDPRLFTKFKGKLYFEAGGSLWNTDGYKADFIAQLSTPIKTIRVLNDKMVLFGDRQNWISDGTSQGTIIEPFKYNVGDDYAIYNNKLYFIKDQTFGVSLQLWSTDGTEVGTQLVFESSDLTNIYNLTSNITSTSKGVFFGVPSNNFGGQLWFSNGINTQLIKDISPSGFATVNDKAIFQSNDRLWVSDGTAESTVMISNESNSGIIRILANGNYANFIVYENQGKAILYQSDATPQGTFRIDTESKNIDFGSMMGYFDDDLYVSGLTDLIILDGRTNIYKKSKQDNQLSLVVSEIKNPTILTKKGDNIFVFSWEGIGRTFIWQVNVKTGEKKKIEDISKLAFISIGKLPDNIIPYNNAIIFTAYSVLIGRELYRFDYQGNCLEQICIPVRIQKKR